MTKRLGRLIMGMVSLPYICSGASAPELRLMIQSAQYCAGDDEIGTLHLRVRLEFVNASTRPLIVRRDPTVNRTVVTDPMHPDRKPLVFSLTTVNQGPSDIDERWPNRAFTAIAPGRTYQTAGLVVVPVKRDVETRYPGLIPGHYSLRVIVASAARTERLHTLQEKWRQHGELWTEDVESLPVGFSVMGNATFRTCEAAR